MTQVKDTPVLHCIPLPVWRRVGCNRDCQRTCNDFALSMRLRGCLSLNALVPVTLRKITLDTLHWYDLITTRMRENVSKAMRFDVFQRDGFTCQYCGRKPPQVVLNADHILAVANGGKSTMDNLITDCGDCNNGKSAKMIDRKLAPLNFSVEEQAEKLEQIKAYQEHLLRQAQIIESFIHEVVVAWAVRSGQDKDAQVVIIPCELEGAIKRFLRYLVPVEIVEAVDIAFERFPYPDPANTARFKFFCGTCWRKIKQKEQQNVQQTIH